MKMKYQLLLMPALVMLWLTACNSTDTKKPPAKTAKKTETEVKIEPLSSLIKEHKPIKPQTMKDETVEIVKQNLPDRKMVLPKIDRNGAGKNNPALKRDTYDRIFSGKTDDAQATIKVTLNFDESPLTDVIPAFAQPLGFNYLLDPEIKGTVTMSVDGEMSRREVWQLFEQILWMTGAYCVSENGVVHVRPNVKMPQERKMFEPGRDDVQVVFYPLQYAGAKDVIKQIKPFLSDAASATEIPRGNAILLVENAAVMGKLLDLLKVLDQPDKDKWQQLVFQCHNVPASKIKTELTEILPILGFMVATGDKAPDTGAIHVISLDRLQVLVATAATTAAIEELKHWAEILDQAETAEQERVFIYRVVNGKADELLQALSVIFNIESTTMAAPQGDAKSGTTATATKTAASGSSKTKNKEVSENTGKTTTSAPTSVFDVLVKVFADGVHNRLVVRTTPRTYAMVKALLERLDTVPAQVLLQVLVAEIDLTDTTQFGLEFSETVKGGGAESIFGTNYASLTPGGDKEYGAKYWIYDQKDPANKFGYVKALAGKTKLKVISSPQVLVVSHTQAKISVGDKVPLLSSQISDTASSSTSSTSLLQTVQYQDTGIILLVTPHVTKGDLITIDLEQTVSEAIENKTSTLNSPVIQERVLKTSMSLRNGRTLIIGGLIKERVNDNLSSVPGLVNIPILNFLTGDSESKFERTEMLILITANVISEETKLEQMVRHYRQAITEINKFQQKLTTGAEQEKNLEEKGVGMK